MAVVLFALFQADVPVEAFRREIVVDVPRQVAWNHFAKVREWPSWLKSMSSVDLSPDDTLGPDTVATLHMGSTATTFRMAEWDPPNHWMWTSRVLWFTLLYDHIFDEIDPRRTRIVFHMRVTGFGKSLFARLVDLGSREEHAQSFPLLAKELNALRSTRPASE
jgi:hypothetical protein